MTRLLAFLALLLLPNLALAQYVPINPPSGGGGTPGGSNTQLQYNNSSAFGGASGLVTTDGIRLGVTGAVVTGSTSTCQVYVLDPAATAPTNFNTNGSLICGNAHNAGGGVGPDLFNFTVDNVQKVWATIAGDLHVQGGIDNCGACNIWFQHPSSGYGGTQYSGDLTAPPTITGTQQLQLGPQDNANTGAGEQTSVYNQVLRANGISGVANTANTASLTILAPPGSGTAAGGPLYLATAASIADAGNTHAITAMSYNSGTKIWTVTCTGCVTYPVGTIMTIAGASPGSINNTYAVITSSAGSFTANASNTAAWTSGGTASFTTSTANPAVNAVSIAAASGTTPGATTTLGELITTASASALSGFNLPHGAAPSSPVNGDLWTTTSGLFGFINGATVTYARNDAAQTFTGVQTFSSAPIMSALSATSVVCDDGSKALTSTCSSATPSFGATTIGGALTYGGVTLSNAVTGTGNMVLSAAPTFTGTMTTAGITTGNASQIAFGGRGILSSPAANKVQIGAIDAAGPAAQSILFQNVVAGTTNGNAGASSTIAAAVSTGSGTSADLLLQTGGTGAGSTAQNAEVTAVTIKGGSQLVQLNAITSDATHTDATVCEDTTTHALYSGSGTVGICLGTSSARFKHDIADLSPGLAEILRLRPVSYRLNADHGDPNHTLYGFTAEDMEPVLPTLVGLDAHGTPNTADYVGLIPVLVKAVQQLQAENTALADREKRLEARVRRLEHGHIHHHAH